MIVLIGHEKIQRKRIVPLLRMKMMGDVVLMLMTRLCLRWYLGNGILCLQPFLLCCLRLFGLIVLDIIVLNVVVLGVVLGLKVVVVRFVVVLCIGL
jgi:hypothetical protein